MHAIISGLEMQSSARFSPWLDKICNQTEDHIHPLSIHLSLSLSEQSMPKPKWEIHAIEAHTNVDVCGVVLCFLEVHILSTLSYHRAFSQWESRENGRADSGHASCGWQKNVYQPWEDALSLGEWVVPIWNGFKAARYPLHSWKMSLP